MYKILSTDIDLAKRKGFQFHPSHYLFNQGIVDAYDCLEAEPDNESYVDAIVNTIMPHIFGGRNGYTFSSHRAMKLIDEPTMPKGIPDFAIIRNKMVIAYIENKTKNGDSVLDAIWQLKRYLRSDEHITAMPGLLFKGVLMSLFFYDQDFHTDHKLELKHPYYDDILGMRVVNKGLEAIPQSNV